MIIDLETSILTWKLVDLVGIIKITQISFNPKRHFQIKNYFSKSVSMFSRYYWSDQVHIDVPKWILKFLISIFPSVYRCCQVYIESFQVDIDVSKFILIFPSFKLCFQLNYYHINMNLETSISTWNLSM